jgi:hypothetical protein
VKDRPCAILVAIQGHADRTIRAAAEKASAHGSL